MTIKKGKCPLNFLWNGQGIGLYLMRTSIALAFMAIFFSMVLGHFYFSEKKLVFIVLAGSWGVGKILSVIKKCWCPEEDSNLHEENLTKT